MDFQPRQDTLAPPQTLHIRWPLALLAPGPCRGLAPDGDGLIRHQRSKPMIPQERPGVAIG